MIATETRKYIVRLILACVFYSACANAADCNDSNKRLYTEIGCTPVYGKDSNSCPVAYDCEKFFTRPMNKCYFNGNVYEPGSQLSDTDAKTDPCFAACTCRLTLDAKEAQFVCAHVDCPSYFYRPEKPCYFQYERDLCCEVNTYCPEERATVHECNYEGTVYKKGQQMYIGKDHKCICTESFNGTINDESCRKVGCHSELLYVDNILKKNAPVFYKKADECPMDWFHFNQDVASTTTSVDSQSVTNGRVCRYGNLSFPLGQNVTIGGKQDDSDKYKTSCSCSVPPLLTCIKTKLN